MDPDLRIARRDRAFSELLKTPWRLTNEMRRRLVLPFVRTYFAMNGVAWGRGWRIFGLPIIQKHRTSHISLGDYLEMRSWYKSNPLAPNHPVVLSTRWANSEIVVGKSCGFTGTVLVAAQKISIGDRVVFGANTVVVDTDFHPIDPDIRRIDTLNAECAPVVIEDDVFIGMNATILKGVRIGEGSTIGAGSVVVHDVPPYCIAAGNPARVVKNLRR